MTEELKEKIDKAITVTAMWQGSDYFSYSSFENVSYCVFDYIKRNIDVFNSLTIAQRFGMITVSEAIKELTDASETIDRMVTLVSKPAFHIIINFPTCFAWYNWFCSRLLSDLYCRGGDYKLYYNHHEIIRFYHLMKGVSEDYLPKLIQGTLSPTIHNLLGSYYSQVYLKATKEEEAAESFCFIYYTLCLSELMEGFRTSIIKQWASYSDKELSRDLVFPRHVDLFTTYYVNEFEGINSSSFDEYYKKMLDLDPGIRYERRILDLSEENAIAKRQIEDLKKGIDRSVRQERATLRKKEYVLCRSIYDSFLGPCLRIFSFNMNFHDFSKDIFLYQNDIVINAKRYRLNDLLGIRNVSESSVILFFKDCDDVLIDCLNSDNLKLLMNAIS